MKRSLSVISLCSILVLFASAIPAFASVPANLIPARATIVGTINVPKVLALPVFANFYNDIRQAEAQAGFEFASLGVLPWFAIAHGSKDPAAAAFVRNLPDSVFSRGTQSVHNGTGIYKFGDGDASVAAKIDGWVVLGNLSGVKAVIDAKKSGQTLASSGRASAFSELASKSSGLLTLAYVPTERDLRKLKRDLAQARELTPFVDSFKGAAFGLDHAGQDLVIKLAALSSADSVAAAANTIRLMKAGYQQQFDAMMNMYAAQMPPMVGQQVRQTWNSVTIQAEGAALAITATMPVSLLNILVAQMGAAMSGAEGGN